MFREGGSGQPMKLIRALELLARPVSEAAPEFKTSLACGFTPLHLQTFLCAGLRTLIPDHRVSIDTGLFGDLIGNVERLEPAAFNAVIVVVEWSDLDSRLGIRNLGGWRSASLPDITKSAGSAIERLRQALTGVSSLVPTVVSLPTLPLPPLSYTHPAQASSFEMCLRESVAALASRLAEQPGIRLVNSQLLDEVSSHAGRLDIKSEIASGFPYSLAHAASLGELLSGLVHHAPPKKGLITDLDDTLWAGILGERRRSRNLLATGTSHSQSRTLPAVPRFSGKRWSSDWSGEQERSLGSGQGIRSRGLADFEKRDLPLRNSLVPQIRIGAPHLGNMERQCRFRSFHR